jgi:ribonuclease VapC
MVIDTSAIFAAITGEPDSGIYRNAIVSAPLRLISAVTLLETQIVLVSRSGSDSLPILDELMERAGIVVVAFDEPMAEAAFDAFKLFGKGQGHKAQLNIIDCAAYALAKTRDLPLLFKGNDFAATDIRPALP